MRFTQGTTDLQLLANGEGLLGTHNLQLPDSATLTTLQRYQIRDGAEVILQFAVDELRELLLSIFHRPAIEIRCLLIEIVQHLREDLLVAGIAIGIME